MRWFRLVALFGILATHALFSQAWTLTKVVDNFTVRPDGQGTFNIFNFSPSIEGSWVVFINATDSIWSYNILTKQFVKLVSTSTAVPGGTGNFIGFPVCDNAGDTIPQLHQGMVVFFGQDAAAPSFCTGGYYSVPVAGGTISKIVDYHTVMPGGGTFTVPTAFPSLDRGRVVISASTQNPADGGIWAANLNGSGLERIVDYNTPYCVEPGTSGCNVAVYEFTNGFISNGEIAFGPAVGETGWNAVFLTPALAPAPNDPILTSDQTLPGDPAPALPPFSQAYYGGPIIVDGNIVYSVAIDPFFQGGSTECGGAYLGVFKSTLSGGGTLASVANTCETFAGITQLNSVNSFNSLAANEGIVIFQLNESGVFGSGNAIYSSIEGTLAPVVLSGQTISDGIVSNVSQPGSYSINGGRAVFFVAFAAQPYGAIYIASRPCAANWTSDVSIALGTLTYNPTTKIYSQTATVTNKGSSAISGPLSLVLTGLPSGVTLSDRNGTTVCFAPKGSPFIDLELAENNKLGAGKSAEVVLQFTDPSNTTISFAIEVAGAGAR